MGFSRVWCRGVWLAALVGCTPPAVSMQEGSREYVADDYNHVIKHWTREESLILFDELERALTVSATFETWDFRWAYVIRYARDYRLTIRQRQKLLTKRLNDTRKSHQFFVALYGGNRKMNDLTKEDSAWIVRLIDATGNESSPAHIEAVKKPNTLERRYYPYNTVWRRAFRISFPVDGPNERPTISKDADWVGLRFAGALGNIDLIWDIDRGQTQP